MFGRLVAGILDGSVMHPSECKNSFVVFPVHGYVVLCSAMHAVPDTK